MITYSNLIGIPRIAATVQILQRMINDIGRRAASELLHRGANNHFSIATVETGVDATHRNQAHPQATYKRFPVSSETTDRCVPQLT